MSSSPSRRLRGASRTCPHTRRALRRPDASPSGRISRVSRKYLGGVWRCLGSVAEREDRAAVEVVPRLAG